MDEQIACSLVISLVVSVLGLRWGVGCGWVRGAVIDVRCGCR